MSPADSNDLREGLTREVREEDSPNQNGEPSSQGRPSLFSSFLAAVLNFDTWISTNLYEAVSNVPEFRYLLIALEHSGDGLYVIPGVALAWLNPWETSELRRQFWLGLIVALLLDLILVGALKSIFRRQRPSYNRGMNVFVAVDHWSFPSGHASRALMLASLFSLKSCVFPSSISIPFWHATTLSMATIVQIINTWAVATASSRILLGRHHFVDVLCGGILGYVEAATTVAFLWPPVNASEQLHQLAMSILSSLGLWK